MTDVNSSSPAGAAPSPALLFDTINAYQKTAAIRSAIELDLFTALADAPATADSIATALDVSPRGVRMLCDYLTAFGFLAKSGNQYSLTRDSAVFLNRRSPAYAGDTLEFLLSDHLLDGFEILTDAVRQGRTALGEHGSVAPDHPMWVSFARSMGPLMAQAAAGLAELIELEPARATRVLDIAAGHGIWGLAFAKRYPRAHVAALDWAPVLAVARENARAAAVDGRFTTISGSAFDVELGADYDVILVPNFLHHFSADDCVHFLRRAHAALRPGGRVAIVEFIPNDDRVSPPGIAAFGLIMLATTPGGDAYTLSEYGAMLAAAGFGEPSQHNLPASMNAALIASKP